MNKLQNVLVSQESYDSSDKYDIVGSNITAVNLVLEEGGSYDLLTVEALESYFVDYYASQMSNGNFSQFVYNSRWNATLNKIVVDGLTKMGAKKHLDYFEKQSKFVQSLTEDELNMYFDSQYFGENETRDKLNNPTYFDIEKEEELVEYNSNWLRGLPNLKVLSIEEMYQEIETLLGKEIEKNE